MESFEDAPFEIWLDFCEESGISVEEMRDLFHAPHAKLACPGEFEVVDPCCWYTDGEGSIIRHASLWETTNAHFEYWMQYGDGFSGVTWCEVSR